MNSARQRAECAPDLFVRAERFLLGAVHGDAVATADLGHLLRALLGVAICVRAPAGSRDSRGLDDLSRRVEHRLHLENDAGTFDPFQYDSKLLLLCHLILSEHEARAPGIEHFARTLATALDQLPDVPAQYTGEVLLLSRLGYGRPPQAAELPGDLAGDVLGLLRAEERRLRRVCDDIAAATQFGTRPLKVQGDRADGLADVLPAVLLQMLRQYDLEMGAILLRTIGYLGVPWCAAVEQAVEFLAGQQQDDGRIGYFAIESEEIAGSDGQRGSDPTHSLHLPITVACVWSLAESSVLDYRLFASRGADSR